MSQRRRQELYCHACDGYVQFVIDHDLDGNHVLHCPKCNHEHCRVVRNGVITDIRWDSRNGPTWYVSQTATNWNTTAIWTTTTCANTLNILAYQNGTPSTWS